MSVIELSRKLTEEETKELLTLDSDNITKSILIGYFAYTTKGKPRFLPGDLLCVPKDKFNTSGPINTTIGRYIFNLFLLHKFISVKQIGFINEPVTKGVYEKTNDKLSELLLIKKIDVKDYIDYLNRIEWLGYGCNDFMSPSPSFEIINPNKDVIRKRDQMIKENKSEIDKGNEIVTTKVEKELVEYAREKLDKEPSFDLYKSGAKMSFENNYKCSAIMKGAVKNNVTGKYHIITNNYVEGVKVKDYSAFADTLVDSAYNVAINTKDAGYTTKKFFSAYQSVMLDKKDSDCKSKRTLKLLLTKDIKELFLFRYIVKGGKLVIIDNDNIDSFIGNFVELRSPLFCISDKICNVCAGDLYYHLGIKYLGLTAGRVSSSILNLCLKKKHNLSIQLYELDVDQFVI